MSVWICEISDAWKEFTTISVFSTEERAKTYGKEMCTEEWEGYTYYVREYEVDGKEY